MTTTAKTKGTKSAPAAFFDFPKFELPKFDLSNLPRFELPKIDGLEIPTAFRDYAEKGLAQAKDAFERAKAGADEVTGVAEATYATATKAATEYGLKLTETARTNANAAFDFAEGVVGARTVSDLVGVTVEHARKQFEALAKQGSDLAALAQKLAAETAAPAKTGFEKALKRAA
jgi:phasin